MKEKIHLERTEAGGQVTWIPKGRIFVTVQEFDELQKEYLELVEINNNLADALEKLKELGLKSINSLIQDVSHWKNVAGIMHEFIQEGDANGARQHYEEQCAEWLK